MTVGVGLVGYGGIGASVHAPLVRRLPGARLVAVAEPDARRRQAAARLGVDVVERADDLLQRDDVEAVIIAAPPAAHARLAMAAFASGRHVYLEKPLATSREDGRAVIESWRRARRVGMIGFNYRFNPLFQSARRRVADGAVGRLVGVRSVFSTRPRLRDGWRLDTEAGGVWWELASHHVDLIPFLTGRTVIDASGQPAIGSVSRAALAMRLDGHVWAHSFFSLDGGDDDRVEIFGDAGSLLVDRYRLLRVVTRTPGRIGWRERATRAAAVVRGAPYLLEKLRSPWHEPSYRRALWHFVEAVRTGTAASPDLEDGFRSLDVIARATNATPAPAFSTLAR